VTRVVVHKRVRETVHERARETVHETVHERAREMAHKKIREMARGMEDGGTKTGSGHCLADTVHSHVVMSLRKKSWTSS
jgi:hypothetical protein